MRLVLATANPGKAAEIAAILGDAFDIVARPEGLPDVVEDAETLEGNARLKAIAVSDATGQAALADDTGLEVDALAGAPGVQSARWAGPEADDAANRQKLLAELQAIGATEPAARTARFRTVMILRHPDGAEVVAEGVVEGHIAAEMRGDGGFGYDSLFIPADSDGRTFAEMSAEDKNLISHRARALQDLARQISSG